MRRRHTRTALIPLLLAASSTALSAQVEVAAWGNIAGIRVEGALLPVESALCVLDSSGEQVERTAKSRQDPRFIRDGGARVVATRLGGLAARQVARNTGPGSAHLQVTFEADSGATMHTGALCFNLTAAGYVGGLAQVSDSSDGADERIVLATRDGSEGFSVSRTAQRVRLEAPGQALEIAARAAGDAIIRSVRGEEREELWLYIPVLRGPAKRGQSATVELDLRVTGEIDRSAVELALDASRPGRRFDGIGGNFRLQHPRTDSEVIGYNLTNLRVAWGRVELPWRQWHPELEMDPLRAAQSGQLDPRVEGAIRMARTLHERDIPLILSIWFPPDWAILPPETPNPRRPTRHSRLNPERMKAIQKSIADYLVYLKSTYGIEPAFFSFNEPERGVDVLQTAQEHAEWIRDFGSYLRSRGISTKLLLGDNADTYRTDYILPAMQDPEVHPYVGAVSFHSWGGWSEELLTHWANAARQLDVPLIIAEASTDAWAWTYPDIFHEPHYAMEEIELYVRLLSITQPLSILQWQLTTDFSILAGGGIFGDRSPLRPTQRFWNLKQLSATPAGVFHLPITCGDDELRCAALGDPQRGAFAVHVVNRGAERPATLSGLPHDVREMRVFVTDETRGMEELGRVPVSGGTVRFSLPASAFITLLSTE